MPYCSCFSFSVGLIPDFMGNYSLSSMVPSKTFTAGPVIDIWPVASSHSMVSVPPSITTLTVRPVRPVRCAATAVAQAPVPQACVMPDPLSQTRIRIVFSPVIWANSTFVRSGNRECFSSFGPISERLTVRMSSTKVTRCGLPIDTWVERNGNSPSKSMPTVRRP